MAVAKFTHRRGQLRIYDGAGTPNYIVIPFVNTDGRWPLNRARPAGQLQLNRDQFDGYTHFIAGSDAPLAEGVPVTFSMDLENQLVDDIIAAMSNPYNLATWSVGTSIFTDASGTGASIYNGAGSLFKPPTFAHDPLHKRVHVEWLFYGSPAGTRDRGFRHEEAYFPPEQLVVGDGEITTLSATYLVYGRMSMITAFTAGTDITPALV